MTSGEIMQRDFCYMDKQFPKVIIQNTIDSSTNISPYLDIPLKWTSNQTSSREYFLTFENLMRKDFNIELRCEVDFSKIQISAASGSNWEDVGAWRTVDCGLNEMLYSNRVQVFVVSLNSGAEVATFRVTASKAIAQMIGAAGFAFLAAITLSF
ncbi:hypothetical protein FGO68_gene2378 [Halteria grandinella]|uniref:Uncharacterized protein n=1 Tax=Halteria grandinella TaxID=5974 RepID=A0A8J8NVB7_HALGN|nr:hypothetical protein FGO68_gene2378 [Halteria grandinella]